MIRESKSATTNYSRPPLVKRGGIAGWLLKNCFRVLERQERATLTLIIYRYVSSFAQKSEYEYDTLTHTTNDTHTHYLAILRLCCQIQVLPTYQVEFTEQNAKGYTLLFLRFMRARCRSSMIRQELRWPTTMQSCLKVDV